MAFEIDPNDDQTAPQASAPAPAAQAAPTQAAPAANTSGRFVGFDQLLQMNKPFAEQAAGQLADHATSGLNGATQAVDAAGNSIKDGAFAGMSSTGYKGPQNTAGAFDNAKDMTDQGRDELAQLGGGPAGIQALFEKNGQSSDAARYNALFTNSLVQPSLDAAKSKFAGFDTLVGNADKDAQAYIDRSRGTSEQLGADKATRDTQNRQASIDAFAPLEKSAQDWAWRMAKDSSRDPFGTKTSKEGFLAALDRGEPGAIEMYNNYFKTRDGNAYAEYVKLRDAARGTP